MDYFLSVVESDLAEGVTIDEYRRVRTFVRRNPDASFAVVAACLTMSEDTVLLALAGAGATIARAG